MADISWITDRIALGGAPAAADVPAIRAAGITDVLDLRGEPNQGESWPTPGPYVGTGIQYHSVPMLDRGQPQPAEPYTRGIAVIQQALDRSPASKVLVHCLGGQNRSPSMVYAYLRSTGMSETDAWNAVTHGRSIARTQYRDSAEAAVTGHAQPGATYARASYQAPPAAVRSSTVPRARARATTSASSGAAGVILVVLVVGFLTLRGGR